MKRKFQTLSAWSFILAVGIFILAYLVYHYVTPELTITLERQTEAGKPLITQLLANLGVLFLFSGSLNLLIAKIFYPDSKTKT